MDTPNHIAAAVAEDADLLDYEAYKPRHEAEDIAKGRMLKPEQVEFITSLDLRTIDRLVERERFPRPIQLSPRRKAWKSGDLRGWLADPLGWVPF